MLNYKVLTYIGSNKDVFNYTSVVFLPGSKYAWGERLNRVCQSDSFTFVTHSKVRRNQRFDVTRGKLFWDPGQCRVVVK